MLLVAFKLLSEDFFYNNRKLMQQKAIILKNYATEQHDILIGKRCVCRILIKAHNNKKKNAVKTYPENRQTKSTVSNNLLLLVPLCDLANTVNT